MQLLSEQITGKLVELFRRHVFIYDVKSDKHRQARGQDLEKGEKCANDLDPNFHCS